MNEQTTIPQVQEIPITCITPSPMNPRKTFSEDALHELAENIRHQGLLQPITVRPSAAVPDASASGQHYEIVCGERRYRACKIISETMAIPCIVRDLSDDEAFDAMITENLQRRDIDPIEEAQAFTALRQRGQQINDIAVRFGRTYAYVCDRIRLAQLKEPLRLAVSAGRITLRGGYLLARLNEADQQAFIEDEYDEDCDYTTSDIEEWLDRHFMNLLRAPFQNGKDLSEEWNKPAKGIRRCQTCDCNTSNHGCLFADMKTEEPQCIDENCYNRKCGIFYERFIQQYAHRITSAGQPVGPGDVALRAGVVYGNDAIKRMNDLKEKMASYGYRVFTEKELPNRVGGSEADRKKALETGYAVEVIELDEMACQYRRPEIACYRLRTNVATYSPADSHFMVSRLCERAASIENNAKKQITACAKKNFDKENYILRDDILEEWEKDILAAIIFDKIPWTEQGELIDGARNTNLTYKEISNFREDNNNLAEADGSEPLSWTRRAIASYIMGEYKQSYLVEAATQISAKVSAEVKSIRKKADERIDTINDELREMGYDENGNKL